VGNIEGRLQRITRARVGPDGAWADGTILRALGERLGIPMEYATQEAILEELRRITPDLTVDRPYPIPRRAPRIEPLTLDFPETTGEGLVLVPVPRLFRPGEMTGRCRGLPELVGPPVATLHPEDAVQLGLPDGSLVELEVDGVRARLPCRVAEEALPGHVLVPIGFPEVPLGRWGAFRRIVRVRVRALEAVR